MVLNLSLLKRNLLSGVNFSLFLPDSNHPATDLLQGAPSDDGNNKLIEFEEYNESPPLLYKMCLPETNV